MAETSSMLKLEETQRATQAPVVIGGIGGSGTRMVASLVQTFGVELGNALNLSLDNLWFTLLFRRPAWKKITPKDSELYDACRIFKGALYGTGFDAIALDVHKYLHKLAADMPIFGLNGSPFDSWGEVADHLMDQQHQGSKGNQGWKEPNSHVFLPSLKNIFPDMKYIHVIRDGNYMSRSTNQNQLNHWEHWFSDSAGKEADDVFRSLKFWCSANSRAKMFCNTMLSQNHYWLKFEDLCMHSESIVAELLSFLDLHPSQEEVVAFCNTIDKSSVRKTKAHQTLLLNPELSQTFTKLGYPLDST